MTVFIGVGSVGFREEYCLTELLDAPSTKVTLSQSVLTTYPLPFSRILNVSSDWLGRGFLTRACVS